MSESGKFWHVLFRDETGKPAAAACLCLYKIDGTLLAEGFSKKVAAFVARLIPALVKFKLLFCGLPVSAGQSSLRFAPDAESVEKKDAEPKELPGGWLGLEVSAQGGRLTVTAVKRGTPGYDAGVNVGDEILAIDDFRVPPEGLEARLKVYRTGEKATLLVARRDSLTRLPVTFGEKPRDRWKLEARPDATPEQKAHLAAWLEGQAGRAEENEKSKAPAAAVPH